MCIFDAARGHELVSDFTWMIGGPQGSGVETAANISLKFSQKWDIRYLENVSIILT